METKVNLEYVRDIGSTKAILYCYYKEHPLLMIKQLAYDLGLSERSVHNILDDLETRGYVKRVARNVSASEKYTFLK